MEGLPQSLYTTCNHIVVTGEPDMCGQDRCEKGSGMYANMIDMGHVSGSGGTKYPLAYEPQTGRFFRG